MSSAKKLNSPPFSQADSLCDQGFRHGQWSGGSAKRAHL